MIINHERGSDVILVESFSRSWTTKILRVADRHPSKSKVRLHERPYRMVEGHIPQAALALRRSYQANIAPPPPIEDHSPDDGFGRSLMGEHQRLLDNERESRFLTNDEWNHWHVYSDEQGIIGRVLRLGPP